jgi:hypothetical protein
VIIVDEQDDHLNPLGVKGLGELATTGVAAAVANAVYHATGVRVRDLLITIDKVRVNRITPVTGNRPATQLVARRHLEKRDIIVHPHSPPGDVSKSTAGMS